VVQDALVALSARDVGPHGVREEPSGEDYEVDIVVERRVRLQVFDG
jgi:hypothetical protein